MISKCSDVDRASPQRKGAPELRILHHAGFTAALAISQAEIEEAQALRHLAFGRGTAAAGRDCDRFDGGAAHLLLRAQGGALLGCCRIRLHLDDESLLDGYSAQFYDLRLFCGAGVQLELGRFCLHPAARHPELLRLGWAAITRICDHHQIARIFGCSSFMGGDSARHHAGLAALLGHIGPESLRPPRIRSQALSLYDLAHIPPDPAKIPPLLRSYLNMGAWVSDHAVIDRDFDSLHVLTCLGIDAIPAGRLRILRGIGVDSMG